MRFLVPRRPRRSTPRSPIVARLRSIGGVLLVVVGLLGLVFPVIPGVPLLMAGVAVLGPQHPVVRPVVGWFRQIRRSWRRWRNGSKISAS
jgi:uncharacterized membrane protein YbaN (DUF454 family)